ncbi:metallophosphoesterase [Rhizobium sp. L1K21]|uniref:metallophosphoesterase n=1 Tax=Rhizobium sp. L1K21 TaxID=2954933 RepID=UPI00209257DF|nr:metallophosphoesterase [Rhizobium sp. L1K21]MCO6187600.1 metallophosphoesterase [Rhizobium sp. L1K21]
MPKTTTFIHLTDLHISNPAVDDDHLHSDTSATLAAILADIATLDPQPEFIVATGDLTNRGDVDSYGHLKSILKASGIDLPIVWLIGNHDTRDGFYKGMLGRDTNTDAPYFHDTVLAGIHVIALDTSVPGQVGGNIEPEQFDWLEAVLKTHPDLPKLITLHHGPALDEDQPDMEWESLTIADSLKLRDTLKGHNILGILSGHVHYDRLSNWYGMPLIVGMGQHAALDPRAFPNALRMVDGTSYSIGIVRPSGLTMALVPQPQTRVEKHTVPMETLKEYVAKAQRQLHAGPQAAE